MTAMVRIVTWNMNHSFRRQQADEQWAYLDSLKPTIALVQEAPRREGDNILQREIPSHMIGTMEVEVVPVPQHHPK
ncbi:hypothetical protein JYT28_01310 [Desulfobulbus sp. AH-315-M07]|nr:hypothetical protein [Desulfobulbus sp. AH-315-M07]